MKRFSLLLVAALLFLVSGVGAARDQVTNDAPSAGRDLHSFVGPHPSPLPPIGPPPFPLPPRLPLAQYVLTYHNDIYRTGVYAAETTLRPANVSKKRFGKIFSRRVLGQISGQPLYVRGVPVNGQFRNVVYVATSENMVYGFDADNRTPDEQTKPLMCAHLDPTKPLNCGLGGPDRIGPQGFYTIYPSNGVSSTPVIDLGNPPDPANGTLYVVAKLDRDKKFHVFGLNLRTLAKLKDVIVTGTVSREGRTVSFPDKNDNLNRSALLISKNQLIIAFGSGPFNDSDEDHSDFHGWVMSYSLPDLVQTGVFVTSPVNKMGGIWQSGSGLAADDQGNIYFMTGNGRFRDASNDPPLQPDLANSFVKLSTSNGLQLVDWYAPRSREVLEACDLDLGASGPAVIQESGKVVGAGKTGILYVLDKEQMGQTEPAFGKFERENWRGSPDCKTGECFRVAENQRQPLEASKQTCDMRGYPYGDKRGFNDDQWHLAVASYSHVHGSPVVWKLGEKSYNLYVWPEQDFLKAYHFDGQKFSHNPVGSSAPLTAAMMSMPGGLLSLSWDGTNTNTGIIWASRPDPNPHRIVGNPFVSDFHDQQHFVSRDKNGAIWDSFFVRARTIAGITTRKAAWRFQQINASGPPAAGDVFVSVFGAADQQHFVYTDSIGHVWDFFFRKGVDGDGTWRCQQINTGWQGDKPGNCQQIMTGAHPAVGNVFVSDFHDQQHFVFRDSAGRIWDSFFRRGVDGDGTWRCQQINTGWQSDKPGNCRQIMTGAHPAAGNVFVSVFRAADQQHFVYTDNIGHIWDSFFRRRVDGDGTWRCQQINTGWQGDKPGSCQRIMPGAHPAAGNVFVSDFFDQQHFVYRDKAGNIWDSFFRRGVDGNGTWRCQQINTGWQGDKPGNCQQLKTGAHPAAGNVFVSVFRDQQHFVYRDKAGNIWDSFYVRSQDRWRCQQINTGWQGDKPGNCQQLKTGAHPAAGNVFVSVFGEADQQHFVYTDSVGNIWDSLFRRGVDGDGTWRYQRLNGCTFPTTDPKLLTPDEAPCNAINKIVPGYLQAFDATPGRNVKLRELWNSGDNPNDRIRWFAKNSPPTIADGKVFVAEFPAPDLNSKNWSATNAFGRLIVYSLLR